MQNQMFTQTKLCFSFLLGILLPIFAQAQTPSPLNMTQIGHLPIYTHGENNGANGGLVANDVTGFVKDGVEYAVVGFFKGTSIISLANPAAPVEIAFFPAQNGTGNDWRDIEYWGGFAYVSQEGEGTGIHIIDLRTCPNNITARWWVPAVPNGATTANCNSTHSVWQENGYLFLNGSSAGVNGTIIYDVNTTPGFPIYKGKTTNGYVHDSFSRNDTLYTSNINDGVFRMYNIADKTNPIPIGVPTITPFVFTHNAWTSNSGTHLFTTDEKANAPVAAYNISDKNNVVEVGQFVRYTARGNGSISHNVYTVANNFIVTANYTEGVTIIDGSRPDNMVEVGNFDTHPAAIAGTPFEGVWGCYPYAPSGAIYAADINEGFYVFQPTYQRACWLEGSVTDCVGNPLSDVTVTILQNATGIAGTISKTTGVYKTGYALPGAYTVTFAKAGYPTVTRTVTLSTNVVTPLSVQLLSPTAFTLAGTSKDATTAAPIGNVKVVLTNATGSTEATTDANGVLNLPCFNGGTFSVLAGKWGYRTKAYAAVTLASGTPLAITLDKGYEDPFAMDLGWQVAGGNCTQGHGVWIRVAPDNITTGGTQITPAADNATDIGNLCYLTGSGGGQPGADDLDLCSTYFNSPNMDLSTMSDPHIKFDYWFQSLASSGATPDDKFWVVLSNGMRTDTVFTSTTPAGVWHLGQDIRIRDFQTPTATMTCSFRVVDKGVNHWVKSAIDAFSVYNYVNTTADVALSANITTQPNPFGENTTVRYRLESNAPAVLYLYNILGQAQTSIVLSNSEGSINIGADLPKGIYELQIEQNGQRTTAQKIVKM
jgi:choice-of-anchor B domain-containing protein